RLHHHLPQVRLRRLVQFSGISFRLHTRITRKALFGAPVSKNITPGRARHGRIQHSGDRHDQ
ncbi:hypothetical protein ACTJLC_24935, partial [Paraburkholderia sp. 22099]|uniref:hypothetical protein n=1 Tax=Paraburkholderia sp. 22099 TaxID=3453875 RepID=UPI003F83E96A